MSIRSMHPLASVPICLLLGWSQLAEGQQAGPSPAVPAATAKAVPSGCRQGRGAKSGDPGQRLLASGDVRAQRVV